MAHVIRKSFTKKHSDAGTRRGSAMIGLSVLLFALAIWMIFQPRIFPVSLLMDRVTAVKAARIGGASFFAKGFLAIGYSLLQLLVMLMVPMILGAAALVVRAVGRWKLMDKGVLPGDAEVERGVLELFRSLPKGYRVLSNVTLRCGGETGDADLIVVSPSGVVSVVEYRCQKGRITGNAHAPELFLESDGVFMTARSMSNPVAEAGRNVQLIMNLLNANRTSAWVRGYVLFANPDAEVHISGGDDVEVFSWAQRDRLLTEIQACEGRRASVFRSGRIFGILKHAHVRVAGVSA